MNKFMDINSAESTLLRMLIVFILATVLFVFLMDIGSTFWVALLSAGMSEGVYQFNERLTSE